MKNFKLIICSLCLDIILSSCVDNNDSLVKKKIMQRIQITGLGMLKDLKIESIQKVNDTTYKGVHSFKHPFLDLKDLRLTRNYFFTADLDSIKGYEVLKKEMKSEGEWVEVEG